MLEFEALLRSYADRVEGYLHSCFTDADEPQQVLFDAMRYSLLAGGKRLRPVLAQAFCELCGGSAMDALPFAAAVEMVHTYSLIHDDLPCMDNDDYRRGRLTNHKVYGEATAVLAGDALLTAAFGHLAAAPLPASRVVKATRVLSLCAGELGMVGGQVLDMEAEHRVCTEEEVLAIQSRKTGALISAACQLGVIAAGGSRPSSRQRRITLQVSGWPSRLRMIFWMWSAMPRSSAKRPVWTRTRTPSSGCTAWKPAAPASRKKRSARSLRSRRSVRRSS